MGKIHRKTIGSLEVSSDGNLLHLTLGGRNPGQTTLNPDELREFIRFARQSLQSELDQRATQRVSVSKDSGLTVTLVVDTIRCTVMARNISLSGVLVDLPRPGPITALAVGQSCSVELELTGSRAQLQGEVIRRAGTAYGIQFPSCVQEGELTPPPSLVSIVELLTEQFKRRWRVVER